ncbi:MAG: DUF4365 domain-containing protein [Methanosarcinaceae archaeon]
MVKKRKIQQKSEDESKGVLITLFKDWIVNPLDNDFGFDFDVRLTSPIDEKTQEVSEISFYVQNKSSINTKIDKAVEDLSVNDWTLYLGQRIPVLIVKYDIPKKLFYWEIAQDYLWDVIEKEDPNWSRQKTKRITLIKTINDLDEIKRAIFASQARITRHHSLNLAIGEGIKVDEEDLHELTKIRGKFLDEYKTLSLKESYLKSKAGEKEESFELLMDVYNSPKNDENKIRSIIGIINVLNIVDSEQNKRIVTISDEAIKLSEDLKVQYLKDYVIILRNQAILFLIIKKMSEIQMGLKVQETQGEQLFSFFYNQDFFKLNEFHQKITGEINSSLKNLLSTKDIYYYLASLPILIEIATNQIMHFAVFNQKIIEEEKDGRKQLIGQCDFVLSKIPDIELRKMLFRSLANYYYWIKENEKSVKYMTEAIKLGTDDNDIFFVEENSEFLEVMKAKPNPYEVPRHKDVDKMTMSEYQDIARDLLHAQGINLKSEDETTSAIRMALEDINPEEYFKHCSELHIKYLNTSPVGMSIGLFSMGSKFIWCQHCKTCSSGFNLNLIFNSFVENNCKDCKYIDKRNASWESTVDWVIKQEKDAEFAKVVENLK